MFRKMLFPTDFSDVSKKALRALKNVDYECLTQKLILLHVVDEETVHAAANLEGFYSISLEHIQDTVRKEFEKEAKSFLNSLTDELELEGFEVQTMVAFGKPAQEIIRIAEEEEVGVITIGSHGKSGLADLFLGSVSERVVRKAKCPVLVIK